MTHIITVLLLVFLEKAFQVSVRSFLFIRINPWNNSPQME